MNHWIPFVAAPIALAGSVTPGLANTYLTVEQAQQTISAGLPISHRHWVRSLLCK